MPIITCAGCGRETNTAVSNHMNRTDEMADGCYARIINGKWVKGCKYQGASLFDKRFVDRIIGDRKRTRQIP